MANLNLSQFTEKTFVADADWTFVWDTAGAISKKVSRNNWLNSGELTTSAPVTISQTWADVAQTFKALVVNAAGTSAANSASGSLLLDLQVGGVSKVTANKDGTFSAGSSFGGYQLTNGTTRVSGWGNNQGGSLGGLGLSSTFIVGWSSGVDGGNFGTLDTILLRDGAANTLALRNGTNAQTFNVYGTSSSSNTVYERMFAKYNSTDLAFQIGTETAGATLRPLELVMGGTRRMVVTALGNVGVGDINSATGYSAAPFEVVKTAAINGPLLCLRSSLTTAGSWASIIFGDSTQPTSYRKGALIYESTSFSANGKFHIALNNDANVANATLADARLTVLPGGNVGIGTTAPSSKLQVSAGDVEVDTIAKGVILKSPDGTRYRVTVANGGTLSVAAV